MYSFLKNVYDKKNKKLTATQILLTYPNTQKGVSTPLYLDTLIKIVLLCF